MISLSITSLSIPAIILTATALSAAELPTSYQEAIRKNQLHMLATKHQYMSVLLTSEDPADKIYTAKMWIAIYTPHPDLKLPQEHLDYLEQERLRWERFLENTIHIEKDKQNPFVQAHFDEGRKLEEQHPELAKLYAARMLELNVIPTIKAAKVYTDLIAEYSAQGLGAMESRSMASKEMAEILRKLIK